MDAFLSRKRRRTSPEVHDTSNIAPQSMPNVGDEAESTDLKLAILSSLFPGRDQADLLEILLDCNGSVDLAQQMLSSPPFGMDDSERRRKPSAIGMQSALSFSKSSATKDRVQLKPLTRKGKTLHLYAPDDIAEHTPCSIIHNFLPSDLATALLKELLPESETFESIPLKMFDRVVQSPHTASFYVDDLEEQIRQKNNYFYNGSNLDDIREILPVMREVSQLVRVAVNQEIATRVRNFYPDGKRLKYQTSKEWQPNAAFVNCYAGGVQSVGYHTDQLTYLGPRAVIGSLSLGVAREFRVRRIVPKDEDGKGEAADASGQIAIHLPHNSLLVMHAEMQEDWKHSIAPARAIDPHPIARNKRINITYRWYRDKLHPRYIPKCRCGVPTVLKAVQQQKQNRGRYMWMCQMQGKPGMGDGCGFFGWAEFTEDGDPIWNSGKNDDEALKLKGTGGI